MKFLSAKLKEHYFLIIILIFASILFSKGLDKPFIGHHDYNGAWHGIAAKNFVRYGLFKTGFVSVLNSDYTEPENFQFYTHYPPLVPIFLYLGFKIFGISELSIRLVSVIFTLATITLIYLTGLKFFSQKVGILAAGFSSLLPIVIYFGKIPTHDLFNLPFTLVSIIFYFKFFLKVNFGNGTLLFLSLLAAHLTHWTGYYLTPLFFFHFLIFAKYRHKIFIVVGFLTFSLMIFGLHLGHTFWLTGSFFGGGLIDIFLDRLNLTDRPIDYTHLNFLIRQARFLAIYFTRPLLILAAIGTVWTIIQLKNKKYLNKNFLLIFLLTYGLAHGLIFRNISFIHDYIIISLWPFLAITASYGFFIIVNSLKFLSKRQIILLGFVLLVLVGIERLNFTRALLASSGFSPGFQLGTIINQKTKPGEKILVLSPDFKRYFEVFTSFYADRSIDYELTSKEELTQVLDRDKFRLIVAIPSRDTPQSLVDILQQHYKVTKIDQFLVYDTQKSEIQ